jgi:hypothetical protein
MWQILLTVALFGLAWLAVGFIVALVFGALVRFGRGDQQ